MLLYSFTSYLSENPHRQIVFCPLGFVSQPPFLDTNTLSDVIYFFYLQLPLYFRIFFVETETTSIILKEKKLNRILNWLLEIQKGKKGTLSVVKPKLE